AVDPVELAEMTGQGAQIALFGEQLGEAADLAGADGRARERPAAGEETGDLLRPFLDLERAGAINQRAARLQHLAGGGEQALLDDGEAGDVVGTLQMRHVRVTADRAGRRARRVEQDAGRLAARLQTAA